MAKFCGLVKNEYIKIFKKVSTKIIMGLIVLCAVGFPLLNMLGSKMINNSYYSDYVYTFQDEIDWAKDSKYEGYEDDLKLYEYLLDKNVEPESWEASFAFMAQQAYPKDQLYNILDDVIPKGDWKKACKLYIENASTDSEKWEYEYRLENEIKFGETWKDSVISSVSQAKMQLESMAEDNSPQEKADLEEIEKIGLYRLENNISVNAGDGESLQDALLAGDMDFMNSFGFWGVLFQSAALTSLIGLLMIIIAGSIVSNEFSQGTIKFLLISPVKRWKILMSKYFTVITVGYLMILLLFVLVIPFTGIFLGFKDISAPYLCVIDGKIVELNPFLQVIKQYLLNSINIVVMSTMAFALSSLFKSSALAIGKGVFSMLAGSTIVELLAALKQDWARYLIFANTDISGISQGNSLFPQHSLTFAVVVIAIHMVVFLLTAWDGFTKREC